MGYIFNSFSVYATHEKEKENESGAPSLTVLQTIQHQQAPSSHLQQLPLTIISTAPRCQMMPPQQNTLKTAGNVETFLGTCTLDRKNAMITPLPPHMTQTQGTAAMASPATRCCNLLGSSGVGVGVAANATNNGRLIGLSGTNTLPSSTMSGYYDAYGGMTGSLGRRQHLQHLPSQQALQTAPSGGLPHEFVGVETLDILQGVSPGKLFSLTVFFFF